MQEMSPLPGRTRQIVTATTPDLRGGLGAMVGRNPHGAVRRPNLIVMGAQGRGGIGLALFGSTTQQVVRAAPCPVLTVRGAAVNPVA
jgi:hypothetical protein